MSESTSTASPRTRRRVHFGLLAIAVALSLAACSTGSGGTGASASADANTGTGANGAPAFKHVFLIVMENKGYSEIIGSKNAPYTNQLANTYGLATQFFGVTHPSLPNYLALVSGSAQGMTTDCSNCSFDAQNLADQLDAKHKSWRAYAEDMPAPCFNGSQGDAKDPHGGPLYVRRHNPWMYFNNIANDPQRCNNVVPLSQLDSDLQNNHVPDFVYIAPNEWHNMHDSAVSDGDQWLASFLPKILNSPAWTDNGVLFLVWDEGKDNDNSSWSDRPGGGHTTAIIAAPNGKTGYTSDTPYSLYSVLRTIQDAWRLGTLGETGSPDTHPMSDFFK